MTAVYKPKESTFLAKKHATYAVGIFAGCGLAEYTNKDTGEVRQKYTCLLKDSAGLPVDPKTGFSPITIEDNVAMQLDNTIEQGEIIRLPIQIGMFQGDSKGFLTIKHDADLGLPQKAQAK